VSFKVWEDSSHHQLRNIKYSLQIILKNDFGTLLFGRGLLVGEDALKFPIW
jgi:hypothetical protein